MKEKMNIIINLTGSLLILKNVIINFTTNNWNDLVNKSLMMSKG